MVGGNGFPYRVGGNVTREPQEVINERKQAYRRSDTNSASALRRDLTTSTGVGAGVPRADSRGHAAGHGGAALLRVDRSGRARLAGHERRVAVVCQGALPAMASPCWTAGVPRAGTSRQHGRRRNVTRVGRADPPLARAIAEAHRVAGQQVRRSEQLNGLFFEEVPEYPDSRGRRRSSTRSLTATMSTRAAKLRFGSTRTGWRYRVPASCSRP